jgi:hypothetical protein
VRRHLIGAGVALHLLAIGLQGLPSPSGAISRAAWADPTVQAELATWAARLGVGAGDLEDRLWTLATAWTRARSAALRPFAPYHALAGTAQSWKMFVAPHVFPTRLRIEVHRGGAWETVFVERSAEHRWLAHLLGNDRLRAVIFRMGWPQYARLRADFAAWVAERAAIDLPGARQVRISFDKRRTPSAAEVRAGVAPPAGVPLYRTLATVPR